MESFKKSDSEKILSFVSDICTFFVVIFAILGIVSIFTKPIYILFCLVIGFMFLVLYGFIRALELILFYLRKSAEHLEKIDKK